MLIGYQARPSTVSPTHRGTSGAEETNSWTSPTVIPVPGGFLPVDIDIDVAPRPQVAQPGQTPRQARFWLPPRYSAPSRRYPDRTVPGHFEITYRAFDPGWRAYQYGYG